MDATGGRAAERRRAGAATRRRAQQAALRLFTAQGYEATSLRQIADAIGINKASLYYHFRNKEAILRSLVEERGDEAEQLDHRLAARPPAPGLLEEAVLGWVDTYAVEKLAGIRFLRANPLIARVLDSGDGERIGDPLNRLADRLSGLLPDPSPERVLLIRMAILALNAAVEAADGAAIADEQVVEAARSAARALVAAAVRP